MREIRFDNARNEKSRVKVWNTATSSCLVRRSEFSSDIATTPAALGSQIVQGTMRGLADALHSTNPARHCAAPSAECHRETAQQQGDKKACH